MIFAFGHPCCSIRAHPFLESRVYHRRLGNNQSINTHGEVLLK
jgi:hypothetical protein